MLGTSYSVIGSFCSDSVVAMKLMLLKVLVFNGVSRVTLGTALTSELACL